jgi:hypothetical protein
VPKLLGEMGLALADSDATSKGEWLARAVMRPDALLVTALAAATVIASKPTKLVPTGSADATATAAKPWTARDPGTSRWILSSGY